MRISATKKAIEAYAEDLAARDSGGEKSSREAQSLLSLLGAFRGLLQKQFTEFEKLVAEADLSSVNARPATGQSLISDALPPLERFASLLTAVMASPGRRNDLQSLITLLQSYESVTVNDFIEAVQSERLGKKRSTPMDISELKKRLDPSLGDDDAFDKILKDMRLLNEADFVEVAKAALRGTIKSKKDGIRRLIKLHKSARTYRLKQAANGNRSAA